MMANRPGGALARRPLQFFWVLDCSGSMNGKKIAVLNQALVDSVEPMRRIAAENPNVDVFMRVLCFSSGTYWAVSEPTHVDSFNWSGIDADGVTDMGQAFLELANVLDIKRMPERGLPPVIVLLTDGQPTDDFDGGLATLLANPWAMKAVRVAIAIGDGCNLSTLSQFTGDSEFVIQANDVHQLTSMIKWASTVPLKAASKPATRTSAADEGKSVSLPTPVFDKSPLVRADEVF